MVAALALLLLVSAGDRVTLLEETVRIPRSQWRGLAVKLADRPATVEVSYTTRSGKGQVRAMLVTVAELERMKKGEDYAALAYSERAGAGRMEKLVARPGEYMVLIDNHSGAGGVAEVDVKVTLLYNSYDSFVPRTLAPWKKAVVVGISGLFLVVVAVGVGWRLSGAFERRGQLPEDFG